MTDRESLLYNLPHSLWQQGGVNRSKDEIVATVTEKIETLFYDPRTRISDISISDAWPQFNVSFKINWRVCSAVGLFHENWDFAHWPNMQSIEVWRAFTNIPTDHLFEIENISIVDWKLGYNMEWQEWRIILDTPMDIDTGAASAHVTAASDKFSADATAALEWMNVKEKVKYYLDAIYPECESEVLMTGSMTVDCKINWVRVSFFQIFTENWDLVETLAHPTEHTERRQALKKLIETKIASARWYRGPNSILIPYSEINIS